MNKRGNEGESVCCGPFLLLSANFLFSFIHKVEWNGRKVAQRERRRKEPSSPSEAQTLQQREGAASELSLLGVMGRSPSAPHGFHSTNSFFSFVSFHLLCLNPLIIKEETSAAEVESIFYSLFFFFINSFFLYSLSLSSLWLMK